MAPLKLLKLKGLIDGNKLESNMSPILLDLRDDLKANLERELNFFQTSVKDLSQNTYSSGAVKLHQMYLNILSESLSERCQNLEYIGKHSNSQSGSMSGHSEKLVKVAPPRSVSSTVPDNQPVVPSKAQPLSMVRAQSNLSTRTRSRASSQSSHLSEADDREPAVSAFQRNASDRKSFNIFLKTNPKSSIKPGMASRRRQNPLSTATGTLGMGVNIGSASDDEFTYRPASALQLQATSPGGSIPTGPPPKLPPRNKPGQDSTHTESTSGLSSFSGKNEVQTTLPIVSKPQGGARQKKLPNRQNRRRSRGDDMDLFEQSQEAIIKSQEDLTTINNGRNPNQTNVVHMKIDDSDEEVKIINTSDEQVNRMNSPTNIGNHGGNIFLDELKLKQVSRSVRK